MKVFGSIYVGSYEVILKVFEISTEKKLKEIDELRASISIISDISATGSVSLKITDRLCNILLDMKKTAKMYGAEVVKVFIGNAVSGASNALFLSEQLRLRVKAPIVRLSNSEQRFLGYEAVASEESFADMIKKDAVLVDVGGASLQITLFVKGKIVTTQHVMLGAYSLRQILDMLKNLPDHRNQIPVLIDKELDAFIKAYLQDIKPTYLILLGNASYFNVNTKARSLPDKCVKTDEFIDFVKKLRKKSESVVWQDDVSALETDAQREAYLILHHEIAERIPSKYIFIPGVSVSEGIAYDYAYKNGLLKAPHDFEEDVLSASWSLSERYGSYRPHLEALLDYSVQIFDALKKYHGMGKRERLLMKTVCILHDCGKYISLSEQAQCSNTIIMNSEILGLSHNERQLVAMTVSYNRKELEPYEALADIMDEEEYCTMVKLLAILRVANAMDRTHKQKMKSLKAVVRDGQLVLESQADSSISLEKSMFREKADFFEQVFSVRPVIKEKRI